MSVDDGVFFGCWDACVLPDIAQLGLSKALSLRSCLFVCLFVFVFVCLLFVCLCLLSVHAFV